MDSGSAFCSARNDDFDQSPKPTPSANPVSQPRAADKALPTRSSFPRRRESSLFQRGMDSGSALRFARNNGFGQSPNQSRQPTNPSAPGIAKRHRPDGPRPGRTPLPRTTLALGCPKTHLTPRATALPNGRHTNPAIDDRTGLSACPTHHRPADNRSCQPLPASHPGNPASRSSADPIRAQFGPVDSRHCHASLTRLAPNWTRTGLSWT